VRRLNFDFAGRRAPRWAGWLMLALGLAFVADLARSYVALRAETARVEARVAAVGARPTAPSRSESRGALAEEIAEARTVVARFAAPWPALFSAIESSRTDDVSLLSIEPDAAAGHVVISGEAKDYLSLMTYVARLQSHQALSRVHLARHEVRDNEPKRPTQFSISARWRQP
jgi:hypothetical protein